MGNAIIHIPEPFNEPLRGYSKGSSERMALEKELSDQLDHVVQIPLIINGKKIKTRNSRKLVCPHDHHHVLAEVAQAEASHVSDAIDASLAAKKEWEEMDLQHRASVFLKAADLISSRYYVKLNAATMLGQSKNIFQAQIDATCELVDFFRFNAFFAQKIYEQQPLSEKTISNRLEYRALEGFVFAVTPFNFTAIAGNLCAAPALMGNTVVWKPSFSASLSNYYLMEILREAGLPDGVINFVPGSGAQVADIVLAHPMLAGIHFTGSTAVFESLWKRMANQIAAYHSYPRIVGETGGKDFIFVHPSANIDQVVAAAIRGAFEFQGQKCSACSRIYLPKSLWPAFKKRMSDEMAGIETGDVRSFENLVNAVIDREAFERVKAVIDAAKKDPQVEIIAGGTCDDAKGFFIHPTLLSVTQPHHEVMTREIFGPVLTSFVYEDNKLEDALTLADTTSPYALTGAVFARDRAAIAQMTNALRHSAGNFYINDKPTGAVVGQQPFGGARKSGTNDKAGSWLNLIRWASPRTIKENFVPPEQWLYPYMQA